MKKLIIIIFLSCSIIGYYACSGSDSNQDSEETSYKIGQDRGDKDKQSEEEDDETQSEEDLPESVKEGKGIGPVKNVDLTDPLKEEWVKKGEAIHGKKCASCHKLTDQRAVGPGWAGITNKRKPEWIMNMIMNTDVMLTTDPEARRQLEECMTRMPNQNLSQENARKVVEFMRKNDLEKTGEKDQAANS